MNETPNPPASGIAKEPESSPEAPNLTSLPAVLELVQGTDQVRISAGFDAFISTALLKHGLTNFRLLFLYDEKDDISNFHSDVLYEAASSFGGKNDILLILQSSGGQVEPAYMISKALKRLAKIKFVVAIPRRAKSAATLIALGADEIHMGLLSQLGPVDPQIGRYPALALSNALDVLADLAKRYPEAAPMFSDYLTKTLSLKDLGYFKRINESAVQYAERLLSGKKLGDGHDANSLAKHFVHHYQDHAFAIDLDEARRLLGNVMVKDDTAEYRCANEIAKAFNWLRIALAVHKKRYWCVGANCSSGLVIIDNA